MGVAPFVTLYSSWYGFHSMFAITAWVSGYLVFSARSYLFNTPTAFFGNNKIFADTIQNFTANPFRRVDLVAQFHHSVKPAEARALLKARVAQVPNVIVGPPPDVEVLSFNLTGTVLAVRPYCHNDHYWQVSFDTNRTIGDTLGSAGYPVPEERVAWRAQA